MQGLFQGLGLALAAAVMAVPAVASAADVEELIVRGTKRDQPLTSVDGQVAVLTAERLSAANVRGLDQLDRLAPDLSIRQRGARVYDNVTLRGQSSPDFYNPAAQVYVDGLAQDQASLHQLLPADLEQVEILYGPQGTLYGKGAVGGVINVVTRRPGADPEAAFSGSYGELVRDAAVRAGGPLGLPGLSGDLGFGYQKDRGEYRDTVGGRRGDATDHRGRVRLRYAPDDGRLDILGSYARERIRSDEEQYVPGAQVATRTIFPVPTGYKLKLETASLTATLKLDGATVTSITGRQDRRLDRTVFGTYSPETQRTFSQELRVASAASAETRLSYVAGVYYSDTDFTFARPGFGQSGAQDIKTTAFFGEATWKLTDRLDLTGGLRWERHDVDATAGFATTVLTGSDDFSAVSPKISLGYQATPGLRLYALFSTGFKAGGFTRLATPANVAFAYDPEKLRNAEAGLTLTAWEGRLRASAAAYFTHSEDYQLFVGTPPDQYLQNVGEAETRGVTVRLDARPTEALSIDGGLAFNHAEFTDYDNPAKPGVNLKGQRLPYASRSTWNIGAQYRFALGGPGALTPRVQANHVGRYVFAETSPLGQASYTLADASLTWDSDGPFKVTAYVNNLGDKTFAHYGFSLGGGLSLFQLGRGREAGVRLDARF